MAKTFRIVSLFSLFLALMLAFGVQVHRAQAQDGDLFTITGVKVDVTADDAVKAREQAMNKAGRDALATLAQRITTTPAAEVVAAADDLTVSSMIRNIEVDSEKLSNVRYIATLTVVFDEQAVREFFDNSGQSYTVTQRRPILILPWLSEGGQPRLWQDGNPWAESWKQMASSGASMVPFVTPLGDIMDVRDYSPASPLAYDDAALKTLETRYGVDDSLIVLAAPVEGGLTVYIYATDGGFPALVRTLNVPGMGEDLYYNGVGEVLGFLQEDWKTRTAINTDAESQHYVISARYANLGEWVKLRSALESMQGVENLNIASVSPQKADVALDFRGDIDTLTVLFDRYNIAVAQGAAAQPVYNGYGYVTPAAPAMTYDIYMKTR